MTALNIPRLGTALALVLAPAAVSAIELGHLDLSGSGAMVSTCGGMGGMGAIGDKGSWLAGQFDCNAQQTASPNAPVAQSAAYAVGGPKPVDTAAQGQTVMGQTKLQAQYAGSNAAGFAVAQATGGWVDTLVLTAANPADNGAVATMSFAIDVSGTLQGQPMGNSVASFGVRPYHNGSAIFGAQGVVQQFTVQGQGQFNFPYDESVQQTVTFNVDITLGSAFELGVFARALAGNASYADGSSFLSASAVDFSNTIGWAGISAVTLGGNPLAYTLASASGVDWTQPYAAPVPEPAVWALWAAGLVGVGAWSRRAVRLRAPQARAAHQLGFTLQRMKPV